MQSNIQEIYAPGYSAPFTNELTSRATQNLAFLASLKAHFNVKALLAAAISTGLFVALPEALPLSGKQAILITLFCIIGWTLTKLPDSLVAVTGALALVCCGVLKEEHLYASLGNELVWLLIAAFVIATVLKASGLMEAVALKIIRPFRTLTGLFCGLTLVIAATAFIIPSTSGRAALLLPVYLAISAAIAEPGLRKPLGLLFPSVILLSAGGSLIGAGAHLIAVDAIVRAGYAPISFGGWIKLALPFALLSSFAATALILYSNQADLTDLVCRISFFKNKTRKFNLCRSS